MTNQTIPKPGTRLAAVLILTACGWTREQIKSALDLDTGQVATALSHLRTSHGIEIGGQGDTDGSVKPRPTPLPIRKNL